MLKKMGICMSVPVCLYLYECSLELLLTANAKRFNNIYLLAYGIGFSFFYSFNFSCNPNFFPFLFFYYPIEFRYHKILLEEYLLVPKIHWEVKKILGMPTT